MAKAGETVHATTAGWVPHQSQLCGRATRRTPLLQTTHIKARLHLARRHMGDCEDSSVRPKLNFLSIKQNAMFGISQTLQIFRHTPSTVKHGGGSVLLRGCFSAAGPARLVKVEGMDAVKYNEILAEKPEAVSNTSGNWRKICFPTRQ